MQELEKLKSAIRRQIACMPWLDDEEKFSTLMTDLDDLPTNEAKAAARTILAALTWTASLRDGAKGGSNELQ